MDPSEYTKLDHIDRRHWFYTGKREIVKHWIHRYLPLATSDLLVDAGMGTGTWLVEMAAECQVMGLDDHEESLAIAIPRLQQVGGSWRKTALTAIDLPDNTASVVTAMDVLEHIPDDRAAMLELIRITKPGGLIVITVPALMALWSDWDVTLQHCRRYSKLGLRTLASQPGAEIRRISFFNTAVLPLIALVRMARKFRRPKPEARRSEDTIPPEPLNTMLRLSMTMPAKCSFIYPPFGVSLLAVLQKKS